MEFEWDEVKSEACAKARRFNFDHAARAFYDLNRIVEVDTRRDYGETRYRLTGKIGDRLYVVVYTPRQNIARIISARKANQREIKRYEASTKEN
ncbi:MAG: BrnT family toxin [Rhodoferax sp.]|uniref:BrnT family toxin n=1 Tax=Rhodoferax sp. TaxID=50421 RepID=UPI003BB67DB3